MKFQVRLLFGGFILSFLVVASLTVLSYFRISRLDERIQIVEHTHTVISALGNLANDLQELNKTSFRFTTGRDSAFLRQFHEVDLDYELTYDTLKVLTSDNPVQQNNLVLLRSDMALYRSHCREQLAVSPLAATELLNLPAFRNKRAQSDTVLSRLEQMKGVENRLLHERREASRYDLQLTAKLTRWLSIVFSLLTLVLFVFLLREFRRRVTYQAELQQKITEIAQSKRELEHIAYATSHDLQEPLRKIRILIDKWQTTQDGTQDGNSKLLMERVVASATRMQGLVNELMTLASLNDDKKKVPCPLGQFVVDAKDGLQVAVERKSAVIDIQALPAVQGYPDQLKMLFKHLLDNALKFSKPGEPARVSISARAANGGELSPITSVDIAYHCIIIEDDGLGFDNRQAEKMFGIFRQLHGARDGYVGKGTGLAICQRIMHNHRGAIIAHGFWAKGPPLSFTSRWYSGFTQQLNGGSL